MTFESVQALLNSDNLGDRIKGLNQLRQIDPKVAFEMIQPLVTDSNPRIRYAAVSQLDPLGKQDLDIALNLLRDRLNNDSEVDVKAAAADVIGGLKLTDAFEELKQLYDTTSEWIIQLSILAALGELGEPRGFDLLETALSNDNSLIVTTAIGSLGELGDKRAIALLLPLVEDEDWQIRYRVAQALGRLNGETATQALEKLSQDSVEQVAKEAKSYLNIS